METEIRKRCQWVENTFPLYIQYHDEEWGVPVHDDRKHFEMLTLEGAQAGLSWSTILKRREGYRNAFANFDVEKVAKFDEKKAVELLQDTNIIRHKGKITSTISNAQHFIEIQKEFGSFDKYVWSFVDNTPIVGNWKSIQEVPAKSEISEKLSKDLKKRGFKFVGVTIMYAYMQACGLVNDHTVECFRFGEV